ncbi:MAG: GAF domain-containing protein [Anaerolineae bacterium]|nr:GAF domain-containing protein [Anaerolineae bacterium]
MTETTSTIRTAETLELQRLIRMTDMLEGQLRQQRTLLQRRGMSLPPGTLTNLQQVRAELERLLREHEEVAREVSRLRELGRTAELINSRLDLNDVLNEVMDTVITLTRAERGYLMLRNPQTGELEFTVARNIEHRTLMENEFIISRTIVADVARTGVPIVTTDAGADERFDSQQSVIRHGLRSILCVPLLLKETVTGVIYADNRIKSGIFGKQELQLLQNFANQAAVAIENARLYEALQASLANITAMRNLLSNVFDSIASGVITTDVQDRITTINPAACRTLNLTAADCLGKPLWQVWALIPPETLQAVREEGISESAEMDCDVTGRGALNLNISLSPLRNAEGHIEGVAIVVDDLTEQKRRERQLNTVRKYLTPAMVDNIRSIEALGLGGERRVITSLFVDVRDLKRHPLRLTPRELMAYLNRYLTVAADAITQHNGIIDKYMANEILGLFNTQLNPSDDHALRAVLAALEMADAFRALYAQLGEPAGTRYFRIGINTGVATLGNVGSETRREFTAVGDSVNAAHRLLENAREGEIVISEATYRACAHVLSQIPRLTLRSTESITVKNRREPMQIYRFCREDIS